MVQIQFLDNNVVGALVPAYSVKPDKVIFLYDGRIVSRQDMYHIKNALIRRLPKTQVVFEATDMLDMDAIWDTLENLVDAHSTEELQIDITGGTELMTACGFIISDDRDLTVTYADYYKEILFNVFTRETIAPISHMTLEDYLCAAGGKYVDSSRVIPKKEDYSRVAAMAEYVFAHLAVWNRFYQHMTKGYSKGGVMDFSMKQLKNDGPCMALLQRFMQYGFCKQTSEDHYRFSSVMDKECMTIKGALLELYIYIQASGCFDEVVLGARIDWNESDHLDMKDNEIDVVVMHRSQPIFISCKMTEVANEAVYEVSALAKRLGGDYAKSLIATTDRIRCDADKPDGMYQRLKKIKVGLIETGDFEEKTPNAVFERALQMTN